MVYKGSMGSHYKGYYRDWFGKSRYKEVEWGLGLRDVDC